MQAHLGRNCIPVQLPIGEERGFRGVVDLVSMKACTFADDDPAR
jgi:elongation factor G